jgi:hypothetical protein
LYSTVWIGPEAATSLKQATLSRNDTSKVPEPINPTVDLDQFRPNSPFTANPRNGRNGINGISFSIYGYRSMLETVE